MTRALIWLNALRLAGSVALSHQVLAEYYNAATTRLRPGLALRDARLDIELFMTWTVIAPELRAYILAFDVQDRLRLSWWDSLIVAAALLGGCTHLLSEDLAHGQDLGGLIVVNPFHIEPDAILT
jgi:predicted nucleic acid-binding protein